MALPSLTACYSTMNLYTPRFASSGRNGLKGRWHPQKPRTSHFRKDVRGKAIALRTDGVGQSPDRLPGPAQRAKKSNPSSRKLPEDRPFAYGSVAIVARPARIMIEMREKSRPHRRRLLPQTSTLRQCPDAFRDKPPGRWPNLWNLMRFL